MLRLSFFLILAAALFADTPAVAPPKAPPEVDAALRARVTQFIQYQIQGKYYRAEQFVAEESKDFFVGSNKPNFYGFEIQSIRYSDDFTKATVVVRVNRMIPVEGFLGHPLQWSMPSRWKIENGLWCWYVDPDDLRSTPFGTMPKGSVVYSGPPPALPTAQGMPGTLPGAPPGMPGTQAGAPPGMPANLPGGLPGTSPALPGAGVVGMVVPDKSAVELKAGAPSSGQVTLVSLTPAPVKLSLLYTGVPGITVKLDRTELKVGERATLTFQSSGVQAPAQPLSVSVHVQETKQDIPIKVLFTGKPK